MIHTQNMDLNNSRQGCVVTANKLTNILDQAKEKVSRTEGSIFGLDFHGLDMMQQSSRPSGLACGE